jgi:hypothetical protein
MFYASLCSIFALVTPLLAAHPSIDTLYEERLETPEGRVLFLTEKLTPYIATANELNEEIQALSQKIEALSPENDQPQILGLAEQLGSKMAKLNGMLPAMDLMTSLQQDLEQIDTILYQSDELSPKQQEIADRIASLCNVVKTE